MALVNEHLLKLPENYLFTDIVKRVNSFKVTHPQARIIHLGIGDVTLPIPKACVEAMQKAAGELGNPNTFRGYGPEQGYDFLIEAILKHDYAAHGIYFGYGQYRRYTAPRQQHRSDRPYLSGLH